MRERFFVFFNFPATQWKQGQALFRGLGREDLAKEPKRQFGYSFFLDNELELQRWRQAYRDQAFGDDLFVRREVLHTDEELRSFRLLRLIIRRAPKGLGGPGYGTEYDLSKACARCGTGALQTSPLVLKRGEIQVPKSRIVLETLDGEILVSSEFGAFVTDPGVTGVDLRPVVASTDKRLLPWVQLVATCTLPPMAPSTQGLEIEKQCGLCRRDGYFSSAHEPEEIRYRHVNVDVAKLPDVVQTWECFGISSLKQPFEKSHFAHPLLLVQPKVFDIFRQYKIREVTFTPVEIVDE